MLTELEVVVVDCQASGATPRHGAILELGWAVTGPRDLAAPIEASWVVPPEGTSVSRPVRELTGWSAACLATAVRPEEAWARFAAIATRPAGPTPCVIHFARFELGFLEDLHRRYGQGLFPLDTVCLHEIARRLYPELPRRNIRALAGYLGHSPELMRRSAGHVEASAFIWRALLPALDAAGVRTWADLKDWTAKKAPPRARRTFPLPPQQRRALPDGPGVYRMLRSNGDVLYVGKAASVKKRVASHFTKQSRPNERALEMLTQVHTVEVTAAATVLEAALLETDEIKRLHPPYNVQLRDHGRSAWFATTDLTHAEPQPDAVHRVGPLPSPGALASLAAIRILASGGDASDLRRRATAVGVPPPFAPDEDLFVRAWSAFRADHVGDARNVWHALLRASKRLAVTGVPDGEESPDNEWVWDLDRIRRHLDRALLRGGQLVRRARWLVLLSEASIAFREPDQEYGRLLVLSGGDVVDRRDLTAPDGPPARPRPSAWPVRQASIDATRYDRLRVLATELARVRAGGGWLVLRIGHRLVDERGAGLLVGPC